MFGGEDSAHQRPAISYNGKDGAYIVVWQYVPDITVVVGGYSRHENIASRSVTAPVDSTQPELPTTGNSTTLLLSALVLSLIGLVATGHRRIRRA
jgi:LPXTG-motif cell wall-anchored protein